MTLTLTFGGATGGTGGGSLGHFQLFSEMLYSSMT